MYFMGSFGFWLNNCLIELKIYRIRSNMPLKIGLISDSHSYFDHKSSSYLQDVDEIWHAGDVGDPAMLDLLPQGIPLRVVYGNIDDASIRERFPEWLEFELEGVKVLMTHIGGRPPATQRG